LFLVLGLTFWMVCSGGDSEEELKEQEEDEKAEEEKEKAAKAKKAN
jgi:hypothetical protein